LEPAEVEAVCQACPESRLDRIDREYAQPLDVEVLARGAHMSSGHFSRQFRLAYGESQYSYLMTRRIERAMALLRRGDLSVTEVCFEVGCSSLGTFSTRFTELVGVPPSAYRRRAAGATRGWRRAWRNGLPDRSGIEKRRWPSRASVAAMDITIHASFLPQDDPDASLAFYRDTLGFEVRGDVGHDGMRWITVGPADQPGTSIVLEPPAPPGCGVTDDERRTIAEMMAKGTYAAINLATKDLDGTFERLEASDAEVVQEPTVQPYGVRDCAFRDPAGNLLRIQER
jgi:AraC-like DNA-binding protein/catechol 2,3-dioxygenase-like lactoylglutathione lyase family enzyme